MFCHSVVVYIQEIRFVIYLIWHFKLLHINLGVLMIFQGVYTFDREVPSIQVDTFCVHGGPNGFITGIRGKVQCVSEEDLDKNETQLEKQEMIKEKCYLRFPTLPFIPKEPYDVIDTDYDNFSLVSGAKDKSFIQVFSQLKSTPQIFLNLEPCVKQTNIVVIELHTEGFF